MNRSTIRRLSGLVCVVAMTVAGCSSGDDATKTGANAATDPAVKEAQDLVAASMKPQTFDDIKPKTPAPAFEKGKRVAVIISTARSTGAVLQAKGFEEAAAAVGWQTTEFDGAGTNSGKIQAMRTALTQGFDAYVLIAVDARIMTDPMKQAHDLGKPVVSTMAGNDPGSSADKVFADAGMDDLKEGRKVGSWIVADAAASNTQAKTLLFLNPVNATVEKRDQAVQDVLKKCSICKINASETYTSAEVAQTVPQRTAALLQLHPDTNYIMIDVGAYAVYVAQAVKQLGADFAKKVKLISFDCVPDEVKRVVAKDVEYACEGAASGASGWAAVDELNRAMHGQPAAANRVPVQLVTADNYQGVANDTAGYVGAFDYKAAWKQFWGVQ